MRDPLRPLPPSTRDFSITQGQRLNLQAPQLAIRAVIVTNLTPFFLRFPNNPAASQWVLPNIMGAVVPVPAGADVVQVNSLDTPTGVVVPVSTLSAQLTATEEALPFNPGVPFGSAPSLIPNKAPALISGVIAAGAVYVIVPGVAGQLVYAFDVNVGYDAVGVGAVFLEDDSGAPANWHAFPSSILNPAPFHGNGTQFSPMGTGIRLFNGASGSLTFRGSAVFSQA